MSNVDASDTSEYEVRVMFRVRVSQDNVVTPSQEAAEAAALVVAGPDHVFVSSPRVTVRRLGEG